MMPRTAQRANKSKLRKSNREKEKTEFTVSTDKRRLNRPLIHGFLANSYWAKGIPKETVERSIQNSLCFGIYHEHHQVGFARVISDFAIYAYIGDVFVVDNFRGQALGKLLMRSIKEHPKLQGLRRWSLVTRDAHGLYAQFGFRPVKSPERHMEIFDRQVYSRNSKTQGPSTRTKGPRSR